MTKADDRMFTITDVDGDLLQVVHPPNFSNTMEFTVRSGNSELTVFVTVEHMRELLEWYRSRL